MFEHNIQEYSVSQISQSIKNVLEDGFSYVKIRGEISNLKIHSSGHIYFMLKDEGAAMNAVCFRNVAGSLSAKPEEGLEVVVTGRVSTYNVRSNYQVIVNSMVVGGIGALMALFEKRKQQMKQQGYFALEHKKDLPKYPKKIAIITSETGAVIRDIIHRIKERYPCHLLVHPSAVQGEGAELEIANALCALNEACAEIDVIIIARGGGSIEDLWCFNEEIVVKAVYDSTIPVISAIGHETDTTLVDYASDLRAPTPTAAAEMVTPIKEHLLVFIENYYNGLVNNVIQMFSRKKKEVEYLSNFNRVSSLLENFEIRCDDLEGRLKNSVTNFIIRQKDTIGEYVILSPLEIYFKRKEYLENIFSKLTNFYGNLFLHKKMELQKQAINSLMLRRKYNDDLIRIEEALKHLEKSVLNFIEKRKITIISYEKLLDSYSYKNVLKRGYAVIRDKDQLLVTSKDRLQENQEIAIEFYDGIKKINISTS